MWRHDILTLSAALIFTGILKTGLAGNIPTQQTFEQNNQEQPQNIRTLSTTPGQQEQGQQKQQQQPQQADQPQPQEPPASPQPQLPPGASEIPSPSGIQQPELPPSLQPTGGFAGDSGLPEGATPMAGSILRVNGAIGLVEITRGEDGATVTWSIPSTVLGSHVRLEVQAGDFTTDCHTSSGGLPGTGRHLRTTPSVDLPVDDPAYTTLDTFYVRGCLLVSASTGTYEPTGDVTNAVQVDINEPMMAGEPDEMPTPDDSDFDPGPLESGSAAIESVRPQLIGPDDTLTITGSGFRTRTAQRRVRLLHRGREYGSLQTASWSDTRITSRPLPNVMESGRYRVRFEEDGEPYSETSYGEGKEFYFFRPQVTGYEPARAALGGVVDVNIGDKPTINFDRFGIEVWLGKDDRALSRVSILSQSPGKLRVRLPDRVPGARPGGGGSGYWIALYRTGTGRQERYSNHLDDLTLVWPEREPVDATTDANCLDMTTVTIHGGLFESGTEVSRQRGSWSPGRTHVEIRSDDTEATRLYDQVKHGLNVVNENEMTLQVPVCFFADHNKELRVIYPNGRRSEWVPIHGGRR